MARLTFLALLANAVLSQATSVWTLNCAPLTIQRSDPIISPGVASGHVHAVVGGTAFGRTMNDVDSASSAPATTCDKFTDHSNYWAPQLYHMRSDGKFDMMPFTGMNAYYENQTCNYDPSGNCPPNRNPSAFPEGLRMIAGNPFRRTYNSSDPWQQAILMETGNFGEQYGMPTRYAPAISGHVRFPSCWDGVNLDSEDHQSHVSYPDPTLNLKNGGSNTQGGMCPQSHPHAMINIGAEFGWDISSISDLKSLVWAQGDTTGYGFHGDFFMGWKDPSALQQSFANCNGGSCPWNSFGTSNGQPGTKTSMLPQIQGPFENIGWLGPIDALPGNNPVYKPMAIKGRQVTA